MADEYSHAPSDVNPPEMVAINEALRAENQMMAELLRQMEHDHAKGERKNAEQKEDNNEHSSETKQTTPKTTKTIVKRTNPFTKSVMNFKMPENLTLPSTLKPYHGIGDPNVHVTKFYTMMFMNKESDHILCRTFPTFLDGAALIWFSNLPEGSISSFDELADQFVNHFTASKIYVHNSDYLSTIKQGPNESLKDYMTRFAEATNEIPNLNPEVHLHALKSGICPGKFQESIVIAKPKTLAEFREKATTQIEIEEFRALRRAEKPTQNREEDKRSRHPTSRTDQRPFRLTPKFDTYTPFNTKREDIVKDILHSKLIKPPSRAGTYQDQRHVDKSKYCAFHQKYGHTTDDCVIAKDVLKKLARQGLLDKYIDTRSQRKNTEGLGHQQKTIDNPRDKGRKVENDNNPPRRIINCISGGFAGGGCTSSARKRSYRAMMTMTESAIPRPNNSNRLAISFNSDDYKATDRNLDDPVVITAKVGEPLVKKILMDPGSSADVLFYSTFQKMNLCDKLLQPSSGELVGFSGRPSLNAFNAVVSTVHLCVKFISQDNKVVTIHGDQKEAKQCYNASLKNEQPKHLDQQYVQAVYNSDQLPPLADLDPRTNIQERPIPLDDLTKIQLASNKDRYTYLGNALKEAEQTQLVELLR
ncbi:uncharacterized protein LOC130975463 [Arachis stenosperma]|uniref:uncharacterized protein LOC130975463 n=1 Tax=Arachis stenosperma TaxID=217475 RepID=UPI0025ABB6D7|nr:uncharacterized protein LOC130975463 [Arachis stenosperma]